MNFYCLFLCYVTQRSALNTHRYRTLFEIDHAPKNKNVTQGTIGSSILELFDTYILPTLQTILPLKKTDHTVLETYLFVVILLWFLFLTRKIRPYLDELSKKRIHLPAHELARTNVFVLRRLYDTKNGSYRTFLDDCYCYLLLFVFISKNQTYKDFCLGL